MVQTGQDYYTYSRPTITYGTGSSRMKSGDKKKDFSRPLADTFKQALASGYRRIDAAEVYGTEAELGVAIAESGLARSDLFVTSKVFDPSKDIRASLARSLELLKLDYVDAYLLHQPFTAAKADDGGESVIRAAWATLEALHAEGKACRIGVSNFSAAQIDVLLATARVRPAVNQTEFHPYLQRGGLKPFLDERGIALEAYSPLTPIVCKEAKPGPLDEILAALARKYAVDEADVLLAWYVEQGVTPIITTQSKQRMVGMLEASEQLRLTPDEIGEITDKGKQKNFRRWWAQFYPEGDFS